MRRRTAVVVMAGALAAACGGGSSPTTPSTPGSGSAGDPTKVVALDATSFEAAVLAASRPGLVEFHSPT
jgi:hypothetical protein